MSVRHTLAIAGLTFALLPTAQVFGQEQPSAPTPQAQGPVTLPSPATPPPAPKGPPPFPAIDRSKFSATSPSEDAVNSFLKASWGYDPDRLWQVQAIEKTPVAGVSKVSVVVEERNKPQQATLSFFVLPDGAHLIASDEVLPFGAQPFATNRKVLQARADGPSRGVPAKTLELVEFSDFQCPHCKDAQPTIDKLLKDFPNAHFVYQNFPLTAIHSEAQKAAEYGVCVAKEGGNDAFFKFADNVFTNQAKLTPESSTAALNDAATAAGQDATKTAACAASPDAKAAVDASVQLGNDLGVNLTPMLYVNGRGLPIGGIPYDTLKQIIAFQMQLDGISAAQ
jgi:protein-disulfide isomerase